MQAQRTFLLVLFALILGILLGWWICERNKKTVTIAEADYVVTASGQPYQTAIGDSVIRWKRPQGSNITDFTVTVVDGICANSPPFSENHDGTMSATASGDEVVICKVLDQSAHVPAPIYKFSFTTNGGKNQTAPPTPPVASPLYAGSCQGCGSAIGQSPWGGPALASGKPIKVQKPVVVIADQPLTKPPFELECKNGTASIAPIVIPSSETVNWWYQEQPATDWTVQFIGDTPCDGGVTTLNDFDICSLKKDVLLDKAYQYNFKLNSCGGNPAEIDNNLFTVSSTAAPKTK